MRKELIEGNFGIEKETLRVSADGQVVSTPHPINSSNDKFKNPHITVDFSEQQVEVITGINPSIKSAVDEIKLLTNIMYRSMNKDEYLWNYSMPFGNTDKASVATGDCDSVKYRKGLLENSTFDMQLISGIHFNFSFKKDFSDTLTDDEMNALYFKISKRYARVSFVTKQMFGMSPTKDFKTMDKISYRQASSTGYHNEDDELKCFCNQETYAEYNKFIEDKIKSGSISSFREVYTNIRMKPFGAKRIQWIEVRNIDLDYTQEYAIDPVKLTFIHQFLMFLAFSDSSVAEEMHAEEQTEFDFSDSLVVLKEMKQWMIVEGLKIDFINKYISNFEQGKYDAQELPEVEEIIAKQINLKKEILNIPLKPIEDMELSTQILIEEAYKSGLPVEMVDKSKNKIKINGTLLEMATLNPFDSKKGLETIDSKIKTNEFLKANGFGSTEQNIYKNVEEASADFDKFTSMKIVVKPVNTNFSKGLSVFEDGFTKEEFIKAIEFALSFDHTVLVEKFVAGQEYRFMVIDNKVIGILKRIPANIIGDGIHTIEELVSIKNQNKLRGVGYKLPLEKIKLGTIEVDYLSKQGLSVSSIPTKDTMIFLRKNSNVSTGGDTYDVTDKMAQEYKDIAIEATRKLDLKVCGLDIIIPEIEKFGDYTILEMNWNPAIHIHTYPLVGKNRHVAESLINLVRKFG